MADTSKKDFFILAVNPGSTSAKIAVFRNNKVLDSYEIEKKHKAGLRGEDFDRAVQEYFNEIKIFLDKHPEIKLDAVVGRGGFIDRSKTRIKGGTIVVAEVLEGNVAVCEDIIRGIRDNPEMDHASNLGIPIAAAFAVAYRIPAFTVDPVVSDDFTEVSRLSGHASVTRESTAHALSVKAIAAKAAEKLGKKLESVNFVAVHMGGGITVAAVRKGKMVDNNIALLGGGPFTPQRVGTLPMKALIDICYSGKFTKKELLTELTKKGGLISYLGEDNLKTIERRISDGDEYAKLVLEGMAYQVSKEIGAMFIAAGAEIEAVVFSGGLARSELFMDMLKKKVGRLAPFVIFTENLEMEALAMGALRVLKGQEKANRYQVEQK